MYIPQVPVNGFDLCSKKASNTQFNNILSYNHSEMSTGIGGNCHFVLAVCSLYQTNQPPNSLSCSFKKKKKEKKERQKKEKTWHCLPNFLLTKSHTWKQVIQLSGKSIIFLT